MGALGATGKSMAVPGVPGGGEIEVVEVRWGNSSP